MVILNMAISKNKWRQVLLGSIGISYSINRGGFYAFNAVLKNQMKLGYSINLSSSQVEYIKSSFILSMMVAAMFSSILIHYLGRKGTMLLMDITAFTSWLLIFICDTFEILLAARILSGIAIGTYYVTYIIFVGEISAPQHRPIFLTLPLLGGYLGSSISQFLTYSVRWTMYGTIFLWFPLYNILCLLYLKESFVTYLDRDNIETALEYFHWYRGIDTQAVEEFNNILSDKQQKQANTWSKRFQLCRSKAFRLPFCIVIPVYIVSKFSGVQAIIYCTDDMIRIFDKSANYLDNVHITVNILKTFGVFSNLFLTRKFTVRFMVLSSGYILCVTLLALGILMHCTNIYQNSIFPILALVMLVTNVIVFASGIEACNATILGEMFPYTTRILGVSLCATIWYLFMYLFIYFLPALLEYMGGYNTMIMFGFCVLFGTIAVHLTLPQTRNKTLLEINILCQN